MNKICCLALPTLLAAACGGVGGHSTPDARPPILPPDGAKPDTANPDSLGPADLPLQPDRHIDPPPPIDGPPAIDTNLRPDDPIDAPQVEIDAPVAALDAPPWMVDAQRWTLWSLDGRSWTVILVNACHSNNPMSDARCPQTYADGLQKVNAPADGGLGFYATGAGRCAEGSYVYAPYMELESMSCYYDATTRNLIGYAYSHDTIMECGDGTASRSSGYGVVPDCTNITWDAYRRGY
jgi:hypothetical protein